MMHFVQASEFEIIPENYRGIWKIYVFGPLLPILEMTKDQALWFAEGIRLSFSRPDQFGIKFADEGPQISIVRWKDWTVIRCSNEALALDLNEAKFLWNELHEKASKLPGSTEEAQHHVSTFYP
jgi:hypothetical protein